MQIKKQQLELDMEQHTGSKLGKEYIKAVYCHPANLMKNTSCKLLGWMKHKLESRLLGEISITSDMQMTSPFWQKAKKNQRTAWWKWKRRVKSWLKTQHSENEDRVIWSHHFMANRWGSNGNSERLYFLGLYFSCPKSWTWLSDWTGGHVVVQSLSQVWLCDPIDCSLPGSSVHGISQARILEWVATFYSRGSSWPRDQTCVPSFASRFFNQWASQGAWWST